MLILDLVSGVVVGLVLGAAWAFFGTGKGVRLLGTLISGTFGGLLGGFLFSGMGVPGGYNVAALVASVVGALVLLFIYSTIFLAKTPQQPTQPTGSV